MGEEELSYEEKFVLNQIDKFEDDDVTRAIEEHIDLPRIIREELAEDLPIYRMLTKAYLKANPDYEKLRDPMETAMRIIDSLKKFRPSKAKRILEGPPVLESDGIEVDPNQNQPNPNPLPLQYLTIRYPEDGIDYVVFLVKGFRRLLRVS